jgi:hypothetical protein
MFSEMTEKELEQMLQSLWWKHAHRRIEPTAAWRQWITSRSTIQACDRACYGGLAAGCRGGCGLPDARLKLSYPRRLRAAGAKTLKREVPDLPF